jgi:hypothetical protein
MAGRKRSYKRRSSKKDSASSVLVGYIVLFFLAIALLQILLPFIIAGAIGWGLFQLWRYWQQEKGKAQLAAVLQQNQLTEALYSLVKEHQGRVSIFDLSMRANVSAEDARQFLDEQAKKHMAHFEPTDSGEILYLFESLVNLPAHQPEQRLPEQPVSNPGTTQPDSNITFNQADLARRLGLSSSAVSRKKFAPDFAEWSQERDPEKWAWVYNDDEKYFYPYKP